MKFKIFYNETTGKVDLSVRRSGPDSPLNCVPVDPAAHVYFSIDHRFEKPLTEYIKESIITPDIQDQFDEINDQIRVLTEQRQELMRNFRKNNNQKIMDACIQFKLDNAELFI